MAATSAFFKAPVLKGLRVDPLNALHLDFILDPGQDETADPAVLVQYFLAALTVPNSDLWVNLSPYEEGRIVPEAFGQTRMGRDLLAQDHFLKQLTAALIYPENETGRAFWDKVYEQAQAKFGTTDIPVDAFNKVWIVPEKARVYENGEAAYVVESRLKVMLEEDYVAFANNALPTGGHVAPQGNVSPSGLPTPQPLDVKATLREVIIPALEKEINEGANFAQVRQAYHSLILALWYKKKVKEGIVAAAYVDRNKVRGVHVDDPGEAKKIWSHYVEAFRKGAFDLIREEEDPFTREMIPRRYFSGGLGFDKAEDVLDLNADRSEVPADPGQKVVSVDLKPNMPLTPKTTWDGRNDALKEFLFSDGFLAVTGLNLWEGPHLIHDIGVGAPPVTTVDLNEFSTTVNREIRVVGSELKPASVRYQVDVHKGPMFEELKAMVAQKNTGLKASTIKAVSFLITDAGNPAFAGVSEVFVTVDGEINGVYSLFSIPIAIAPDLDYQMRRKKLGIDDVRRNTPLFFNLINRLGIDTVKGLVEEMGATKMSRLVNDGEIIVWREPVRTMLEAEGIGFFETDGKTPPVKDADVVIASNVVMHLNDDQRVPFFASAMEQLREGGVLVVQNAEYWVDVTVEQVDVYQKQDGKRVYLGSFVYDHATDAPYNAAVFAEYKKGLDTTMLGYPLEEIKYIFDGDAAEITAVEGEIRQVSGKQIVPFTLTAEDAGILRGARVFLKDGQDKEKALWQRILGLVRQIKSGVPVRMDLSGFPNEPASVEPVTTFLGEMAMALEEILLPEGFKYVDGMSMTKVTFSIRELLKNAIIYGNKADLGQPVYVWIKNGGATAGGMNTIYVIDMGAGREVPGLADAYKAYGLAGNSEGVVTMRSFGSYRRGNMAAQGRELQAQYSAATILDAAEAHDTADHAETGGIDFQPAETIFESSGPGVSLRIADGGEGLGLDHVQGLNPVIISIQPLQDPAVFLGTR